MLEIFYGEQQGRLTGNGSKLEMEGNPDLVSTGTILRIATASDETGEMEENGKHTLKYRISENADERFDLRIYLRTFEGGLCEMNTDVTLALSDWTVLGGLTRESSEGTPLSSIVALRVVPRERPVD